MALLFIATIHLLEVLAGKPVRRSASDNTLPIIEVKQVDPGLSYRNKLTNFTMNRRLTNSQNQIVVQKQLIEKQGNLCVHYELLIRHIFELIFG